MTQLEYLKKNYHEETPAWLKSYSKGQAAPLAKFLHSRIVYYPGSGWDWHPIEVFGGSCSAHCFIYVDYLLPEAEVVGNLLQGEYGLEGYQLLDSVPISETELRRSIPWKKHYLTPDELLRASEAARGMRDGGNAPAPYARLVVLERKADWHEGAERIAVLFLGADGHATFEAVFANRNASDLFCFLIQEHGFGGNYDRWGKGGLCDKIMQRSKVFPKFVLTDAEECPRHADGGLYDGYQKIHGLDRSGSRARDLYERATGAGSCDIVLDPPDPKEFKRILLETRRANRVRVHADGRHESEIWHAEKLTENSDLMTNIKTSRAYRRASADGVVRLEFNFDGIYPSGS